jgi:cephalosporin hydroxylase
MQDLTGNSGNAKAMQQDVELATHRRAVFDSLVRYRYTYNFNWLGRPIIQTPEDMVAVQEIVFDVKPDLIVETGVAHGGSLVYSASLLQLLGKGEVVGIDIDIRAQNRAAIESHALAHRIHLISGSSVDSAVLEQVRTRAADKNRVLVMLDSNHTHEHVFRELQLYAPLVKKGSYVIVFDTAIEDVMGGSYPDRPWGKGNNPKTAVRQFLKECDRFEVNRFIENKLLFSVAPEGYLKCVKD